MKKEFVSYDQALALKELGFEEECFKKYIAGCLWSNPITPEVYENIHSNSSDCLAPLYQQVFRWFRDKHKLVFFVNMVSINIFYYVIDIYPSDIYKTYEEAENACIDKLIEIQQLNNN